jgi:hypothetical protein
MTQTISKLISTLESAKMQMMESIQTAGQSGQWERAEWMIQRAKDLDEMILVLRQNGTGPAPLRPAPAMMHPRKPPPEKLPYYYTERNKLVKVGRSRDGSSYKHRVLRVHIGLMIDRLAEIARKTKTFETSDLIKQCDVPKHEPLIILDVLKEQHLLINVRRGRWDFINTETFRDDAQKVWAALPQG